MGALDPLKVGASKPVCGLCEINDSERVFAVELRTLFWLKWGSRIFICSGWG